MGQILAHTDGMSVTRRWVATRRTVLLAMAASAVAGMGVGGSAASAGTGEPTPVPPEGHRYDSGRLVVVPAPARTLPEISEEQATTRAQHVWNRPGQPDTELMIANGGVLVDEDHPTTSGGYGLTDRLVWVLTWRDVPGVIRGPRMSPESEQEIRRMLFTDTVIVDATTGQVLYSAQHGEWRAR